MASNRTPAEAESRKEAEACNTNSDCIGALKCDAGVCRGAAMAGGWSSQSIAAATEDCGQRLVGMAKQAFARKPETSGHATPDFPEQELRDSTTAMCGCIVQRAAATSPLAEWQADFLSRFAPYTLRTTL